eukprot:scaffold225_cov388-Prasinococcus_capsulatus_cf.AAC.52
MERACLARRVVLTEACAPTPPPFEQQASPVHEPVTFRPARHACQCSAQKQAGGQRLNRHAQGTGCQVAQADHDHCAALLP